MGRPKCSLGQEAELPGGPKESPPLRLAAPVRGNVFMIDSKRTGHAPQTVKGHEHVTWRVQRVQRLCDQEQYKGGRQHPQLPIFKTSNFSLPTVNVASNPNEICTRASSIQPLLASSGKRSWIETDGHDGTFLTNRNETLSH